MVSPRPVRGRVFPAHAGMNRHHGGNASSREGVPRTRGDEPDELGYHARSLMCSPHTRGVTVSTADILREPKVFPAHAGMNRMSWVFMPAPSCVPRTRGDEPVLLDALKGVVMCSPHTRG